MCTCDCRTRQHRLSVTFTEFSLFTLRQRDFLSSCCTRKVAGMWIFSKVADWFDKTRAENVAWIDRELQPWVATTLYDDSHWYRKVGVWTAAGTLHALNKFTTTVASGFVDVLRVEDGIRKGGWG